MVRVVIDSDIIIDYLRIKKGIFHELLSLQSSEKIELYLSAITILELFIGKSSKKSKEIEEILASLKIISLTPELARFAGEMKRENNLSNAVSDLIIGATTISINAKIATRNKKHFQNIPGLKFFN